MLASGGVDSAALICELLGRGCAVQPLFVRSGLRWEKAELYWLRRQLRALARPRLSPLAVIDVPVRALWGRHWSLAGPRVPSARAAWDSVYLPGRNLLLLSEAGVFCRLRGIGVIALATLKGNPFPDASPAFRAAMERCLAAAFGARARVIAPYARLTKKQVVARAAGVRLDLTFSCLKPRGVRPCGACSKCAEKMMGISRDGRR